MVKKNEIPDHVAEEVALLKGRAEDSASGRYIALEENNYDNRTLYKVFSVDGEKLDSLHPLEAKMGRGWPQPVIFVSGHNKHRLRHSVFDNREDWCSHITFAKALTERGANKKAYDRAKNVAKHISNETGFPLVERTSRYSGAVETDKDKWIDSD